MTNPHEGLAPPSDIPETYWVAEFNHGDSPGYTIGVYSNEDKAMAGAVKFIQQKGWPQITDFTFKALALNVTTSRV